MKETNDTTGLKFNLLHLKDDSAHISGEILPAETGLDSGDELIHFNQPIKYDLEINLFEDSILVRGSLRTPAHMECSKCLAEFEEDLDFQGWACHIPLEGEDAVQLENDCVDLTPFIREDILLALPAHPVCGENCPGAPIPITTPLHEDVAQKNEPKAGPNPVWGDLDRIRWDEEE